jgi:hypothetical protein
VNLFTSEFLNGVISKYISVVNTHFLQCFATLLGSGVVYGYTSLIVALTAIACTQFDKLKAAILDIRAQHITPQRGEEDEQDHTIANCEFQAKLNACIRHHQEIIE